MDRATGDIYEARAREWIEARHPKHVLDGWLGAFARRVRRGGRVADLGCGPGWYAAALRDAGLDVVALDLAAAMLADAKRRAPGVACVRADLAALPFARGSLDGAWACNTYCHLPTAELPLALADLHAALRPGAAVEMTLVRIEVWQASASELLRGEAERRSEWKDLPGRLFSAFSRERAVALFTGAGFENIRIRPTEEPFWMRVMARRARTLPDLVRPGLRLLVCGLNPSLHSADRGVPFARPGNRFWPAAVAAGLVERERDARHALERGIGTTDLVKRASSGAAELRPEEYRAGMARLEALVRLYQPGTTCFVGLDGWRRVRDRKAEPGWVAGGFGGRPAYLMPSTSGRNARVPLAALAAHLRAAANP